MSKEPETVESVGSALVEALGSLRTQSVSLHDPQAEILWLNEGVMGPDEHSLVMEASQALSLVPDRGHIFQNIGDGRSAVFVPARTPQGDLVGIATIIVDTKWLDSSSAAKAVNAPVVAAMRRFAILRRPHAPKVIATPPPPAAKPATRNSTASNGKNAAPTTFASPMRSVPAEAAPSKARWARKVSALAPISFDGTDFELHVQQLLKLRSGGGTRRYEVLARRSGAKDGTAPLSISETVRKKIGTSGFDRLVVENLLKWLAAHPQAWDTNPASFSINLSMSSIDDPKFLAFVNSQLRSHCIPPPTLGFELSEHSCVQQQKDVDLFIAACEKLGCFVVIDDFTMHSSAVPWLASQAVRFVKIDPRITTGAMNERLSQAMVVAMSQASKVLGISCVAKRIDTPAARQWLSAVGVDYAQGFLLEQPRTLESLAEPAPEDGEA
jgi:EAL domain-containing protein (putative c-di-GMP-specific phosphodiesterase class I)